MIRLSRPLTHRSLMLPLLGDATPAQAQAQVYCTRREKCQSAQGNNWHRYACKISPKDASPSELPRRAQRQGKQSQAPWHRDYFYCQGLSHLVRSESDTHTCLSMVAHFEIVNCCHFKYAPREISKFARIVPNPLLQHPPGSDQLIDLCDAK